MRFNDPGYVDAWRTARHYPPIHDDMMWAATEWIDPRHDKVLDLCSSTGLLGRRVRDRLRVPACAVEADTTAIRHGVDAGVYGPDLPVLALQITNESLPTLLGFLDAEEPTVVLARRCILELDPFVDLGALARGFAQHGVRRIILEGHKVSVRVTNPLVPADAQAARLCPPYQVQGVLNDVRMLDLS